MFNIYMDYQLLDGLSEKVYKKLYIVILAFDHFRFSETWFPESKQPSVIKDNKYMKISLNSNLMVKLQLFYPF